MKIANENLKGASDVYNEMLRILSGEIHYTRLAKSQMKSIKVEMSFIVLSVKLLGLSLESKGNGGIVITK